MILKSVLLCCFIIILFSCNDTTKTKYPLERKIVYEEYSNNKLDGYSLRKYMMNYDTIREKYVSMNLKGEIREKYHTTFLKTGDSIFVLYKDGEILNKKFYFSIKNRDTCNDTELKFNRIKICYLGKINFQDYKDVHKIYYEEKAYDGETFNFILDKDFTIIEKNENIVSGNREIISKSDEVNQKEIKKLDKLANNIKWW